MVTEEILREAFREVLSRRTDFESLPELVAYLSLCGFSEVASWVQHNPEQFVSWFYLFCGIPLDKGSGDDWG